MIYADIVDEFEALKQQYGFLNFNDLLIKMRELCQSKDLGYKEVLIDEYANRCYGYPVFILRGRL